MTWILVISTMMFRSSEMPFKTQRDACRAAKKIFSSHPCGAGDCAGWLTVRGAKTGADVRFAVKDGGCLEIWEKIDQKYFDEQIHDVLQEKNLLFRGIEELHTTNTTHCYEFKEESNALYP